MKMQLALIMLMLLVVSHAADLVAINSFDGRDVLSGIFYANVKGLPARFMPSQGGNADIFAAKAGSNHSILLIQSSTLPVSGFVEGSLRSKGNSVQLYPSADGGTTNLELGRLSGASSFIVVDSAYSDSALSVLPYARLTSSYVLLSNKGNAAQIGALVAGKRVIIYGLVDKEVSDALASNNPQYIGRGEDKFEDNVAICQKTMDEFNISRAIVSDGSFIEESMALGDQPILLSGKLVPAITVDFITQRVRSDKLSQVLLIGNELVVPTFDMREKMKRQLLAQGQNNTFGIVVKFAQVIPSSGASVLVLDTFRLPAYIPALDLAEVDYNTQTKSILASVSNVGDGAAYYSIDLTVKLNGQQVRTFPAREPVLIQRGEQKGMEFPFDMSNVTEGNLSALVLVKYGVSKLSLDGFVSKEGPLLTINYTDTSDISVQAIRYNSDTKVLQITLKNNGPDKAYSFSHVTLDINGTPATIASSGTKEIDPSSLIVEDFPLELTDADIASNSQVKIDVDYGGRPGFLLKKAETTLPLTREGGFPVLVLGGIGLLVMIAVIAAIAYYALGKKKTGKEKQVPAAKKTKK